MSAPEIIILGGPPCSGKSEIGQNFTAIETDRSTVYVPAPVSHNTRVLVGSGPQMYEQTLVKPAEALETLIHDNRASLMVLDDATLSAENAGTLKKFASVLALCNVTTGRDQIEDASDTPALDLLRYEQRHPFFELDGTRPPFENVAALRSIIVACRAYNMRLPGDF